MAQRSHVPKFGNWESEENVPYTVYFDKARKGRTGGMINPNDPQQNPDAFSGNGSPSRAPPSGDRPEKVETLGQEAVRPTHEDRKSRDDDMRQFVDSPGRNDNRGRRGGGRIGTTGEGQRKPTRSGIGSEHSIDQSPLHPNHPGRAAGRGGNSPYREGKNSTDSSHGTPGRARAKPHGRGDDNLDRGAAVPKFGAWDESNPSSADGFTHIFNKVREEKQTGAVRVPGVGTEPSHDTGRNKYSDEKTMGCCCWGRK